MAEMGLQMYFLWQKLEPKTCSCH